MTQKQHAPAEVQVLVNTAMTWAEAELKKTGRIGAAAAWLETGRQNPHFRPDPASEVFPKRSVADQERALAADLDALWRRGNLTAAVLAAPVLYRKRGSTEPKEAIRLHLETANGYCADVLMPYRIRRGAGWRRTAENRVHFSHPVAQESEARFGRSSAPGQESVQEDDAEQTQVQGRLHDLRRGGDV